MNTYLQYQLDLVILKLEPKSEAASKIKEKNKKKHIT